MRIFVVFFLAIFGTSASSAEFFILPGTKTLLVLGETKGNDVAVIKQHLEEDAIDGLILKGPGGSLSAGYAIADLVADYKLSTTVSANTDCASACSLIFSAGNVRIMESGSRLGFHLPFLDVSNYEITEGYCRQLMTTEGVMASPSNNIGPECLMLTYQQGLKDIQKLSRILARDRISSKVLDLVIDTPSGDMRWVSVSEATEYGLTSTGDNKTAEEEEKSLNSDLDAALANAVAAERERSALVDTELSTLKNLLNYERRESELRKQQVAALRTQLQELSGLLYLAEQRHQEAQVQLQSLGSDLNSALARAVAEERRRRVLEEQQRKRLGL